MNTRELATPQLAPVMGMPVENVYQMLTHPQYESFRPEKAYNGRPGMFNERQTLLMLVAGDLVRFGIKAPLAGSVAARAAETLLFNPDAAALHIEFRANGASFTFTTEEAPDAAVAAGPARFRITFDLRAYNAAVAMAMGEAA